MTSKWEMKFVVIVVKQTIETKLKSPQGVFKLVVWGAIYLRPPAAKILIRIIVLIILPNNRLNLYFVYVTDPCHPHKLFLAPRYSIVHV